MRGPIVTMVALAIPLAAHAGDPPAHAEAMTKAAKQVADLERFQTGVGAPKVAGASTAGMFEVPTDSGAEGCPLLGEFEFPDSWKDPNVQCSYSTINGFAINEPDHWRCWDERQPKIMSEANYAVAPVQSRIAVNTHSLFGDEAALACNWNHFVRNPGLRFRANQSADRAFQHVRDHAEALLAEIVEKGATDMAGCNEATFEEYYRRTGNSLHYVQDSACEHHADGNIECGPESPLPTLSGDTLFDYAQAKRCVRYVNETKDKITDGTYSCDRSVVSSLNPRRLDFKMDGIVLACRGVGPFFITPAMSLACMGFERTVRHHCRTEATKTLSCQGPANDHDVPTNGNATWCEGERFPGDGGEDFLAKAIEVTVQPLADSMDRWAEVCKEPDDPCDPGQCDNWCKRSQSNAKAGYCVSSVPDDRCTMHTCVCDDADACGASGDPCCADRVCSGGLECGPRTGTCVEPGTEEECETTDRKLDPHVVDRFGRDGDGFVGLAHAYTAVSKSFGPGTFVVLMDGVELVQFTSGAGPTNTPGFQGYVASRTNRDFFWWVEIESRVQGDFATEVEARSWARTQAAQLVDRYLARSFTLQVTP